MKSKLELVIDYDNMTICTGCRIFDSRSLIFALEGVKGQYLGRYPRSCYRVRGEVCIEGDPDDYQNWECVSIPLFIKPEGKLRWRVNPELLKLLVALDLLSVSVMLKEF